MPQQPARQEAPTQEARGSVATIVEPATFGDVLRLLAARRVQIAVWYATFVALGGALLALWLWTAPAATRGLVSLGFQGIEKHEYPSGRAFTVEDLRSPDVLRRALDEAGLSSDRVSSKRLLAGIQITPVVPTDVQARWRRQERDGSRRDDFKPSEFDLVVAVRGLDRQERARLFDALIVAYRETVRADEIAASRRVPLLPEGDQGWSMQRNDPWDIPGILSDQAELFEGQLAASLEDARRTRDVRGETRFREIDRQLESWRKTRLESVKALVYHERLVGDERLMGHRLEERVAELDVNLQRVRSELEETEKLLEKVDRPSSVVAGQTVARENSPLVDTAVLERIVKNDYMGPVVKKATELSVEIGRFSAQKATAQRELEQLRAGSPPRPSARLAEAPAMADLERLLKPVTADFNGIVQQYLRALDEFLQAEVIDHVRLREGPVPVRSGTSIGLLLGGILVGSALLAVLVVLVRDVLLRGAVAHEG